jgi:WbqC-like protein
VSKTVAILQSSYIPWKGYFDLIRRADEFILYDDAQYTRRDWRNRNRIKTPGGPIWLTIPVEVKGKYLQAIKETRVSDRGWNRRHWRSIQASYARAPHFGTCKPLLEDLYLGCESSSLSEINHRFISRFCDILSIKTPITWSMSYQLAGDRTERLVALCRQAHATAYLSGPSARAYLETKAFEDAGIAVRFMDYDGYPEYAQLYPPFDHRVSLVDLLVHTGPAAADHLLPLSSCRDASRAS